MRRRVIGCIACLIFIRSAIAQQTNEQAATLPGLIEHMALLRERLPAGSIDIVKLYAEPQLKEPGPAAFYRRDYSYTYNPHGYKVRESFQSEQMDAEAALKLGVKPGSEVVTCLSRVGDLASRWDSLQDKMSVQRDRTASPSALFSPEMIAPFFLEYSNLLAEVKGRRLTFSQVGEGQYVLETSMHTNGYERQYYAHDHDGYRLLKIEAKFRNGIHLVRNYSDWRSIQCGSDTNTVAVPGLVTTYETGSKGVKQEVIILVKWKSGPVTDDDLAIPVGENTRVVPH